MSEVVDISLATRNSESSAAHSDTEGVPKAKVDEDGNTLPEPPHTRPRRRSSSEHGNDAISSHKPPVEFVQPIEGTPAAEALAANKMIKVSKVTRGFHKMRGMKRPKMKNFNLMKKLNKTTKKKRKKKHFSKNFKGKVIDGVHELYTLTAGIMLGIRCTVGHAAFTATTVSVPDFTSVSNIAFPPDGSPNEPIPTPPHGLAHTFKFKSYSPKIFHRLREFFDISAAAYMDSVCGDYNFIEFISNSKSGQFFFYSHDGQYMLKTQTKEENKFMIRILPHYYQYLTENPHSLLVRILGMHRIKMYHLRRKVHFVVMTSVFDTPAQINTIYDLKGSLVGREATAKERESGGVLKDNDLINDNRKLHFGAKKAAFMAQLEKDAMFLAKLNIMDYSLLVGIHDRKLRTRDTLVVPGGRDSSTSAPAGSAAIVQAASAANAPGVSHITTSPTETEQIMPPVPPPVHPTHSNTPFRRASANAELGLALAAVNIGEGHGSHVPGGSPSGATRKRRASTSKSDQPATTRTTDTDGIRLDMSSTSNDEDQPSRTIYPNVGASHDNNTAAPRESEVEEETEGEEEEGEDGEVEGEEEDDESDESEFEDVDAGDSEDDTDKTANNGTADSTFADTAAGELVVEDGAGALGVEGFKLGQILRADAVTGSGNKADSSRSVMSTDSNAIFTFGPGQARRHPWTARRDEGINSRTPDGKRGDEIYYLGVIDILQQYNANKRAETIFKGVTHDRTQISSVHPKKYARRFVSFMNDNID